MSTTVLPQLRTVEAELASQEKQLAAQLESVREKLNGIQTVISMFSGTDTATAVASKSVVEETIIASNEPKGKAAAAKKSAVSKATKATKTAKQVTATKKATTTKKAAATKKAATTKKATAKKKDGRTATWQKYTRPGVRNESIPDAVKLILETQPNKDFKIAEVMDSLFKESMPKTQYLKARNRISNVLSGGVRAGDWYKGQRGTYRMTAA